MRQNQGTVDEKIVPYIHAEEQTSTEKCRRGKLETRTAHRNKQEIPGEARNREEKRQVQRWPRNAMLTQACAEGGVTATEKANWQGQVRSKTFVRN